MNACAVRTTQVAPQPWRNGGGSTRELFAWPVGQDWQLRISLADIAADGPFSSFAGVRRWFAVAEGAGVVLSLPGAGERRLTTADNPIAFDGEAAPGCRLIAGATRDLNLMLRSGARGVLLRAVAGEAWDGEWSWRACFTAGAARWQGADGVPMELAPMTLLHGLGQGPCDLVAHDPAAPMFWIGADLGPAAGAR